MSLLGWQWLASSISSPLLLAQDLVDPVGLLPARLVLSMLRVPWPRTRWRRVLGRLLGRLALFEKAFVDDLGLDLGPVGCETLKLTLSELVVGVIKRHQVLLFDLKRPEDVDVGLLIHAGSSRELEDWGVETKILKTIERRWLDYFSVVEFLADLDVHGGAGSGSFAAVVFHVPVRPLEARYWEASCFASVSAENERRVSESTFF